MHFLSLIAFIAISALVLGYAVWWNLHGGGKQARLQAPAEAQRRRPRLQMNLALYARVGW